MHILSEMEKRMKLYAELRWQDVSRGARQREADRLTEAHTTLIGEVAICAAIDAGVTYATMEALTGWHYSALHAVCREVRKTMPDSVIMQIIYGMLTRPGF